MNDCFNCKYFLFLGNTEEGICICVLHRIQIEPNPNLACRFWKQGVEFDEMLHDDRTKRSHA